MAPGHLYFHRDGSTDDCVEFPGRFNRFFFPRLYNMLCNILCEPILSIITNYAEQFRFTVIVHYNAETGVNDVYYTEDRTKFSDTLSNYEFKCSTVTASTWYKDLQYTPQFELFVAPGTGTHNQPSTYFTDYIYSSNSKANRTAFIGGRLGGGSGAGWFCLGSGIGLGNSDAAIGCRLVYLP